MSLHLIVLRWATAVALRATAVAVLAGTTLGAHSLPPATRLQVSPPAIVNFTISVRGQRVGQENVTLTRTAGGWLISATGSQANPSNFTIDKFEAAYTADWEPLSLDAEAQAGSQLMTIATKFAGSTATSDIMQGGRPSRVTHTVNPRSIVLPNNFFGAYEAVAARLVTSGVGTVIPIYVVPQAEITGTVTAITSQRIQTPDSVVELRHFSLSMKNPSGTIAVDVSIDAKGRLARVAVPSSAVVVLRGDLSNVMTRDASYQNDGDKPVFIPALGFTIAATTTSPAAANPAEKFPAIVLIGDAIATDRDETAFGIPIFGQLSGELARAGYFVVRYDKRGIGQSGGRPESATLRDYADDAVSIVNWLRQRKDIDSKRIALVGRGEGGAVALLAADTAGDRVAALGLIAAPGQTGRETILAQQQHVLSLAANPAEEKRAMIEMQTRILDAVVSGKWTGIPAEAQRAAETMMFKSWVEFDPAAAMKKTDQPILIVQGALDMEIQATNADRLEAMAKARKTKAAPLTKKVVVPGLNHLLVPATSGEMSEYPSLAVKTISPAVVAALVDWLPTAMTKK